MDDVVKISYIVYESEELAAERIAIGDAVTKWLEDHVSASSL